MNELNIQPLVQDPLSATDRVFDALYEALVSCKLPPGTKISETEIAKQLNVSRQPVRDAFFRLANLGFLSIRPQRATLITRISEPAIHDAVFTRIALEVECLREAMINNAEALIASLAENLSEQKKSLEESAERFHELDEAFHKQICVCAGHAHVWSLIRERKAHLDRIRFLSLSKKRQGKVLFEHRAIFDIICAGEVGEAEKLLRVHIGAVKVVLPKIISSSPDYFEPTSDRF
jgi:DNA-binding GntR family transcriptional regulator